MRKLLLTAACLCAASLSFATDYTDSLVVTVDGNASEPLQTTVTVDKQDDGTINFKLSNFILSMYDEDEGDYEELPVGNIELSGIELTEETGYETFTFNGTTQVTEGDLEGVDSWFGPLLGDVPLALTGKMTDNQLYLTISITMAVMGEQQTIDVAFGSDFEVTVEQPDEEGTDEEETDEPSAEPENITVDYTEKLVYTVAGESSLEIDATVTVETREDGNINVVLNNFVMGELGIGNIRVDSLHVETVDSLSSFSYKGNITITAGDRDDISLWMGPQMGELPVEMTGMMTERELYLVMDIDLGALGTVNVVFGKETTLGITSVSTSTVATGTYDLSGRRVQKAVKPGIYIVDGKKVTLK
ncbi:MAG: calycin-like domain-containing protein [Prevotellaceae bacterium]|nr:calycin-like domain-containing protein [Prevotellaceae bacterium]